MSQWNARIQCADPKIKGWGKEYSRVYRSNSKLVSVGWNL